MKLRRILAILLSVLLLCVMTPFDTFSAASVFVNTDVDFSYTITNGEVTIDHCPQRTVGDVIIPDTIEGYPVTAIDSWAFAECTSLTSVTIPDTVTVIGEYAFYSCSSLTSIIIPSGVTVIEDGTFCDCPALASISLPDTLISINGAAFTETAYYYDEKNWEDEALYIGKHLIDVKQSVSGSYFIKEGTLTIGGYAFGGCENLTAVAIPETIIVIDDGAFYDCTSLTTVVVPNSVTTMGEGVFSYCSSLVEVVIGDNVTSIGDRMFEECTSLTAMTIPDSVVSIGDAMFVDCSALVSITIGNQVASIGESAFVGCSQLVEVIIPDSVTTIENRAFDGCNALTSVIIGDGVTTIGESAFSDCVSLKSVTFGDSVTNIGKDAFYGCISLLSIVLPDSVSTIGWRAFLGCDSLATISLPEKISFIDSHAFRDTAYYNNEENWDNDVLYINQYLIEAKVTLSGNYNIKEGTRFIGVNAFCGCRNLVSVTIPNGVVAIGDFAFDSCDSLTSVTIPDSVTTIGDSAFYSCDSLKFVTIGDSVTAIGRRTFYGCISLMSVIIGDSVTTIENGAFLRCYALIDVYYTGTEEDRASVEMSTDNDPLLNATWHYNYVPSCAHVYDGDTDPDCNVCGMLRWAVCPDTDVTIRNEDGTTLPVGTTVTVDTVKADEIDVNLDAKAALVVVYDISLLLDGQEIQPDGVVAVTLPAPADVERYTDLQVVYIDDEGNITPCETVINADGTITFYTDHFSYYAIVGTPATTPGDLTADGEINNRDLVALQQYLNGWDVTVDTAAADVNADGEINNRDLVLLQQYLNGWDVTLG